MSDASRDMLSNNAARTWAPARMAAIASGTASSPEDPRVDSLSNLLRCHDAARPPTVALREMLVRLVRAGARALVSWVLRCALWLARRAVHFDSVELEPWSLSLIHI